MGCDIHVITEIKRKDTNKWELVKDFVPKVLQTRNYNLFSILANIRQNKDNILPYINKSKGLPSDISCMQILTDKSSQYYDEEYPYDIDFTDIDYHSHSYITCNELVSFYFANNLPDDISISLQLLIRDLVDIQYDTNQNDVEIADTSRIVFAFDN